MPPSESTGALHARETMVHSRERLCMQPAHAKSTAASHSVGASRFQTLVPGPPRRSSKRGLLHPRGRCIGCEESTCCLSIREEEANRRGSLRMDRQARQRRVPLASSKPSPSADASNRLSRPHGESTFMRRSSGQIMAIPKQLNACLITSVPRIPRDLRRFRRVALYSRFTCCGSSADPRTGWLESFLAPLNIGRTGHTVTS